MQAFGHLVQHLGRFVHPTLLLHHRQQFLASVMGGTDHDQDARPVGLQTHVEVDAVYPHVGVALAAQVPLPPDGILLFPDLLEPHDGGRRKTGDMVPENSLERLRKARGGKTFQIQCGYQGVDAGGSTRIPG